tara:strand:+ start:11875 stop:12645 length:771 start_codon:yes stop_codon:yes gene_type:complete
MFQEEKNNLIIYPLPVLQDNIVWAMVSGNNAVIVDPSITEPIENWLKSKDLNLLAILQTHHHEDHIGGTKNLLKEWPNAEVIASAADLSRIPFQTISVKEGDLINLMNLTVQVLEVPGHTKTHIAFFINNESYNLTTNKPVLFCGDTLFAGGCGRLFEGTPKDMFLSLNKLNSFPLDTKVYCAHEYTEANLRWANSLFPENIEIKNRLEKVVKQRQEGLLTLPSSLSEERKTNLFIQAKSINEFSYLREHKDSWSN